MDAPTLADVTKLVAAALEQINPSECRVGLVLNQFAARITVSRNILRGAVRVGLTSAAHDSDPETVARRLLADLS